MTYNSNIRIVLPVEKIQGSSLLSIKHGDTLNVRVLNKLVNGLTRVNIQGFPVNAIAHDDLKQGDSFKVRVQIQDNKIFLYPILSENNINREFIHEPSIYNNQTFQIISILQELGVKINDYMISKIIRTLKKVDKSSKNKIFLATILEDKGIDISDQQFDQIYKLIFNEENSDNTNTGDKKNTYHEQNEDLQKDIFIAINHIKGKNFHWIIIPFKKKIVNTYYDGSCSMLLDIYKKQLKQVVLRIKIKDSNWIFIIENNTCKFEEINGNTEKNNEFISILEKEFVNRGLNIVVQYGITNLCQKIVDISV